LAARLCLDPQCKLTSLSHTPKLNLAGDRINSPANGFRDGMLGQEGLEKLHWEGGRKGRGCIP